MALGGTIQPWRGKILASIVARFFIYYNYTLYGEEAQDRRLGMEDLTFELLLDKYRKEVVNSITFPKSGYWREKSNETYERLISRYHVHSLQHKQDEGNQSPDDSG